MSTAISEPMTILGGAVEPKLASDIPASITERDARELGVEAYLYLSAGRHGRDAAAERAS